MDHEFDKLDYHQFELLCESILTSEGFKDIQEFAKPGEVTIGIDWIATAGDGTRWVAQAKKLTRPVSSSSIIGRAAIDLQNGLMLTKSDRAVLMISVPLPPEVVAAMQKLAPGVEIWDAMRLNELLQRHTEIQKELHELISAQEGLEKLVKRAPTERTRGRARSLIARLEGVPRGTAGWRDYEDICIDILVYCFVPPLHVPKIQSWSEDGLDRRDAIFPIGTGNLFWDSVKHQHSSRMVVAEFKNYTEAIRQAEVESLQQYLLPKALRSFGLLCSREAPSESAIQARRRAWMIAENIILFLSDGDLKEMLLIRDDNGDPADLLDAKLDEFFIHLAP